MKGVRRYSKEAGGMEIPCVFTFTGKRSHVSKLKRFIENPNSTVIQISDHFLFMQLLNYFQQCTSSLSEKLKFQQTM